MNNKSEKQMTCKKEKMWSIKDLILDYKITDEDENIVIKEFLKKIESKKNNKPYKEDWTKDTYMKQYYQVEKLDLTSREHRRQLHKSFEAKELRLQSFWFLIYANELKIKIKNLMELYNNIDKNERDAICIKEIIKRKEAQITYIEYIRKIIDEAITTGEEAIMWYGKYIEMF